MQLHGNAALSVKKRLVLCQRVVEQEWTLTKAAAAAEGDHRPFRGAAAAITGSLGSSSVAR